jgi:glycosyltransferase involved in cell wall biosynthesis
MKKLALIIPVYNEEEIIKKIVNDWKNILAKKTFDLIIVNDGSKDRTKLILDLLKKKINNIKILNKKNSGHGDAILLGYRYAIKKNYKFIFQVDSDNQFSSLDFKKLWTKREKDFDLILGYRKDRKDSKIRIFLSKVILNFLINFFFQKNIRDLNTPFRLIKNKFLKKFINNCKKKYLAPNILMCLQADKIIQIPVQHFKRSTGIINWSLKKILFFGIKLSIQIIDFKINSSDNKLLKF